MALTSKRYKTEWTSEDSIAWRMYIIPSNADYIAGGPSTDVTLPSDFLLRDLSIDTELGSIPAGMVSQVCKLSCNIAALQGSADLDDLRENLLRGTTTQKYPIKSDGTAFLTGISYDDTLFDAFNTFIFQYNDGSGWKVAFIGCQKYSAENELEITSLDKVIKFNIEIYDIMRCIGEVITPVIWQKALAVNSDAVAYSSTLTQPENTNQTAVIVGDGYFNTNYQSDSMYAMDILGGNFITYLSTFKRLKSKIDALYSAYMRTILRNVNCSFVAHQFFSYTELFKNISSNFINADYLCYVAEIWEGSKLVGGAHRDAGMFEQFTNFHEVYKSITENALEIARLEYSFTAGNPDSYTMTVVGSNPYPALGSPSIEFNQDNTYSAFKIKMFSEALNQVKVSVTSIKGASDTESFEYGKQGTSGDNSKDLKIMFHNVPIITSRGYTASIFPTESYDFSRSTINAGYILYFEPSNLKFLPRKVNTVVSIFFGGEDYSSSYSTSPYMTRPEYQMLLEQQESTLPTIMAKAMVNFLGRSKQAEGSLTSNNTTVKFYDVGNRCEVNLSDYNTLLEDVYGAPTALAVITNHSHKVYEGMVDITLRIDAESE